MEARISLARLVPDRTQHNFAFDPARKRVIGVGNPVGEILDYDIGNRILSFRRIGVPAHTVAVSDSGNVFVATRNIVYVVGEDYASHSLYSFPDDHIIGCLAASGTGNVLVLTGNSGVVRLSCLSCNGRMLWSRIADISISSGLYVVMAMIAHRGGALITVDVPTLEFHFVSELEVRRMRPFLDTPAVQARKMGEGAFKVNFPVVSLVSAGGRGPILALLTDSKRSNYAMMKVGSSGRAAFVGLSGRLVPVLALGRGMFMFVDVSFTENRYDLVFSRVVGWKTSPADVGMDWWRPAG